MEPDSVPPPPTFFLPYLMSFFESARETGVSKRCTWVENARCIQLGSRQLGPCWVTCERQDLGGRCGEQGMIRATLQKPDLPWLLALHPTKWRLVRLGRREVCLNHFRQHREQDSLAQAHTGAWATTTTVENLCPQATGITIPGYRNIANLGPAPTRWVHAWAARYYFCACARSHLERS
jgi:hypothetical protein